MVLVSVGARHVVYGIADDLEGSDPEGETTMLVFDCDQQRELLFLHIPKNAGTTIEDVAHEGYVSWGRFKDNWGESNQAMPDGSVCSHWHVPPHLKKAPNPYANPSVDIFCVTRDPWLRMRSEYTYSLTVAPQQAYVRGTTPCTSQAFNSFVVQKLNGCAHQPYMLDCHLVPQWNFVVGPDGRRWCKEVIPITQLTPRFNALMTSYNLPLRLAPHTKQNVASGRCPALSALPVADAYWPPARAAMRRVYKEDFAHLGDQLAGAAGLLVNASARAAEKDEA